MEKKLLNSLFKRFLALICLIAYSASASAGDAAQIAVVIDAAGGQDPSITVHNGLLAVAYYEADSGANDLKLWYDDGSGAGTSGDGLAQAGEIRVIDSTNNTGQDPSIVSYNGNLAISYYDVTDTALNVWIDDGGTDSAGTAGDAIATSSEIRRIDADGGQGSAITVIGGRLAVAYAEETTNDTVKLWVDDGLTNGTAGNGVADGGEVRTIEDFTSIDGTNRVSITTINGQLAVSYYDDDGDDLRLWLDNGAGGGTAGDNIADAGELKDIEATDDGTYSSITTISINGSDQLAVSWYDDNDGDLQIWVDNGAGGGNAADGVPDAGEIRDIDATTAGAENAITTLHERVAIVYYDDAGDDLQIWVDNGAGGGTSNNATNDGEEDQLLDGNNTEIGRDPAITRYNGGFAVAYRDTTGTELQLIIIPDPVDDEEDARIWDDGNDLFTDTFTDGDSFDLGTSQNATSQVSAVDSKGRVYTAFVQNNGSEAHIFLSRFNGVNTEIWDHSATAWTTTFSNGEPIDKATAEAAGSPAIAIDSNDDVYVTYIQANGGVNHLFLSRYDASEGQVEIWDHGGTAFTQTLANGDPIDDTSANAVTTPVIAISPTTATAAADADDVYICFIQNGEVMMTRYDSSGAAVGIWDEGTDTFNATLNTGDSIDGIANTSSAPAMAIDSQGIVYVAYINNGGLYSVRYDEVTANDMEGYDEGTTAFSTTLGNADEIDDAAGVASAPSIATVPATAATAAEANDVYIAYVDNGDLYLDRFDSSTGDMEICDPDEDVDDFVLTTSAAGDAVDIDGSGGNAVTTPKVAVTSTGTVYIAFVQSDGTDTNVYLSRWEQSNTVYEIWDDGVTNFDDTPLTVADPIDTAVAGNLATAPNIGVDFFDQVYVSFLQEDASNVTRVHLTRLVDANETIGAGTKTLGIWDNDTSTFNATPSTGDGIDNASSNNASNPFLAMGQFGRAYVTFLQTDGTNTHLFMSRLGEFAGSLSSASVVPASLTTSVAGDVTVSFTTAKRLQASGKVTVTLPAGFTINSGGTTAATAVSNFDGTLTTTVSGQSITVARSGNATDIVPVTTSSFTLSNIMNPTAAGSSGTYEILAKYFDDQIVDTNLTVSASTIVDPASTTLPPRSSSSSTLGCLLGQTGASSTWLLYVCGAAASLFLAGLVFVRVAQRK